MKNKNLTREYMNKNNLNEFYRKLYNKAQSLRSPFISASEKYNCEIGFFNGHYSKNEEGNYEMEYYPIPVISIIGCCDIEVGIDMISISTKLSRNEAETFDYSLLKKYEFEAYGVENYLDDYYTNGMSMDDFKQKIKVSNEQAIGFSFLFDELDEKGVYKFVDFLVKNKFFY